MGSGTAGTRYGIADFGFS